MNMIKNKASEREEIEALLPWHAAGTLSRRDAQKVEQALARDAELSTQYDTVRQDLVETIGLNESLGAPSARAMQKLMADIEADASTARRVKASFNLGEWLSDKLSSFSPRTLAWSATAAALAIVLQAGLLAGMFVNEKQGGSLFDTASVSRSEPAMVGTYALISCAPQASAADIPRDRVHRAGCVYRRPMPRLRYPHSGRVGASAAGSAGTARRPARCGREIRSSRSTPVCR